MSLQLCETFLVTEEMAGERFDVVLSRQLSDYSRTQIQAWVKAGDILLDDAVVRPRERLVAGQCITIDVAFEVKRDDVPQPMDLAIIAETEDYLVLNKPVGLVVHPGAGVPDGTLMNGLLAHHTGAKLMPRAGIVHRLDRDTSGLMVVAKTVAAYHYFVQMIAARAVSRTYLAVVVGEMPCGRDIDLPIGRDPRSRLRMAVVHTGKPALTKVSVLWKGCGLSVVRCRLETGRTHQIRVHLSHIGYPLVGDRVYGKGQIPKGISEAQREMIRGYGHQALHAVSLGFVPPAGGEAVLYEAPMPSDMQALMTACGAPISDIGQLGKS